VEEAKILLVEDEGIVALDIQSRLSNLGYTVPAACSSGEAAIEKATEMYPDLVLMDIRLKGEIDGIEAARQIQALLDIPVVYLTAHADAATVERAKQTGPFGYVLKPVEERELQTNIEMALYRHKSERRLRESRGWLATTLRSIGDAVIATDPEGCIVLMNPVAEELTGWRQNQALGRDSEQVFHIINEHTRTPCESPVKQALQQGISVGLPQDTLLITRDGTEIPIDDSAAPIRDEKGNIDGIVLVFRDITERKQAEKAMRRHNRELALLNQAGHAFNSTLDLDQVLMTILEQVRRLLGVTASSIWLTDQRTGEVVCWQATGPYGDTVSGWRLAPGEGFAGWVASNGQSLTVADTQADERHFSGVDQTTGLTLRSILTVPLQVQQEVIGVIQVADTTVDRFGSTDLTLLESLAASAAIAIANARLVEELRRRTTELEARNEELDAFAHTAAHDLKNPLGIVVGYVQVLEDAFAENGDRMTDEEVSTYLRRVAQTGHKMDSIIEELLLLSAVRQEEIHLEPLDSAQIVTEAQARLENLIEECQAEVLAPDTWPEAVGYGPWVEEVIVNYLSNAIKYGGQPPRVELGGTAQPDGMVRFWVRDNGPGIPPEAQAKLFTPFTRLDQVRANGHGLGLSIVRRIVEKLGGQVGVESSQDQGSVFSFTLPGVRPE
jgi:PAS domain S-box-containing protein